MKRSLAAIVLACLTSVALADDRGQLTVTFSVSSKVSREVLDADGTWLHATSVEQTTRMVCPIETSGVDTTSYLAQARPDTKAPATGRFQVWYSEGCTGSLTANNRVTVSKGATVKQLERVAGTRPLTDTDANVAIETDLNRASTRLWIVTPAAANFPRESIDARKTAVLAAVPDGNVFTPPAPGGLKNGSFEKVVPGGRYRIDWTFKRGN